MPKEITFKLSLEALTSDSHYRNELCPIALYTEDSTTVIFVGRRYVTVHWNIVVCFFFIGTQNNYHDYD